MNECTQKSPTCFLNLQFTSVVSCFIIHCIMFAYYEILCLQLNHNLMTRKKGPQAHAKNASEGKNANYNLMTRVLVLTGSNHVIRKTAYLRVSIFSSFLKCGHKTVVKKDTWCKMISGLCSEWFHSEMATYRYHSYDLQEISVIRLRESWWRWVLGERRTVLQLDFQSLK